MTCAFLSPCSTLCWDFVLPFPPPHCLLMKRLLSLDLDLDLFKLLLLLLLLLLTGFAPCGRVSERRRWSKLKLCLAGSLLAADLSSRVFARRREWTSLLSLVLSIAGGGFCNIYGNCYCYFILRYNNFFACLIKPLNCTLRVLFAAEV